jgi:hypothetical protein
MTIALKQSFWEYSKEGRLIGLHYLGGLDS